MKPFETADHLRVLFHSSMMDNSGRLKLVERIREDAIAALKRINPEGYDLKIFSHANYFTADLLKKDDPGIIPYRDALNLLRECTSALETGTVGKRHIELIPRFYAGLDSRLTSSAIGRANRIKNATEKKTNARKIANEILAKRKKKLTIKGLWRLVALELTPKLSGKDLEKAVDSLRKQHKDLKPSV